MVLRQGEPLPRRIRGNRIPAGIFVEVAKQMALQLGNLAVKVRQAGLKFLGGHFQAAKSKIRSKSSQPLLP